jgi:hypothetical protein
MDGRSTAEEAPEVPMDGAYRDKVGAEQLQQVPPGDTPRSVGVQVGQDRPGRPNPCRGRRHRHLVCGIGIDGVECATTMGNQRALRGALAVSPRSSPAAGWPTLLVVRSRARRISTRRLGPGSNRLETSARSGVGPGCAGGRGPEHLRGEVGARGRTPKSGTQPPATAAASAKVTAQAIHASRPAGRHDGPCRPARCE